MIEIPDAEGTEDSLERIIFFSVLCRIEVLNLGELQFLNFFLSILF